MESRIKSAFQETINLGALAAAFGLSIITLNPVPFIIGLAIEAGYLLTVPDSKWYSDVLAQRQKADSIEYREYLKTKVFEIADRDFVNRYNELEAVRTQLDDDYMSRPDWRDVIDRLDSLLMKFLEFGNQEARLQDYIERLSNQVVNELPNLNHDEDGLRERLHNSTNSANSYSDPTVRWVETQMGAIRIYFQSQIESILQLVTEEEKRIASGAGNSTNKDTLNKRIELQRMMLNQAEKIGEGLVSLNQQMSLMEETIKLINGQIKSKQPGQVLLDIENLVDQSETVSNFLHEISPFEDETQRIMLSR